MPVLLPRMQTGSSHWRDGLDRTRAPNRGRHAFSTDSNLSSCTHDVRNPPRGDAHSYGSAPQKFRKRAPQSHITPQQQQLKIHRYSIIELDDGVYDNQDIGVLLLMMNCCCRNVKNCHPGVFVSLRKPLDEEEKS